MATIPVERNGARITVGDKDIGRTGPSTLAGRYLRLFWHPVFHADALARGRTRLIRVMGEDFALYRGRDGEARLVQPRCPHRGMLLSAATVEEDGLRCFYHGWKFDGDGRCLAQPA